MVKSALPRRLSPPSRTFFLFGPRGVGKSTWLRTAFSKAVWIDLLKTDLFYELTRHPENLESKLGACKEGAWVVIDEVQKVPSLLDEVHRLIESRGLRFVLTGSSARKLKRGGANLLGGRALTRQMETFSWAELRYNLSDALEWGLLPLVALNRRDAVDLLASYVETYLKEEVREEGLVRSLAPFARFLEVSAIVNGQQINGESIARDAKVPRASVDAYFSILEDTLLGHRLLSYRPQAKVREVSHAKFYWFDSGVARAAAGLLRDAVDATSLGFSLESLIFHELRCFNHFSQKNRPIFFYRTGAGSEIDFVIETKKRSGTTRSSVVCIEVKASKKWERKWEAAARSLAASDRVNVKRMIGVYRGTERLKFDDFEVYPVEEFLDSLHSGKVY